MTKYLLAVILGSVSLYAYSQGACKADENAIVTVPLVFDKNGTMHSGTEQIKCVKKKKKSQ